MFEVSKRVTKNLLIKQIISKVVRLINKTHYILFLIDKTIIIKIYHENNVKLKNLVNYCTEHK